MKRHLLIVLAAAALLLAACGDDSSSDDTDAASDTTAATESSAPATSASTPATTAAPTTGEATVALAEVGDVGEALVGPDGRTLYLFEMDSGTTSACTAGCADVWPALAADGEPVGGEGVDSSLLSTEDGQVPNHVAYNGHLLY